MYSAVPDGEEVIPAVPPAALSERNKRQIVDYWTQEEPGTIIVDPNDRFLYYVLEGNRAVRYGVAVGEEGRGFSGEAIIPYKREWPSWTPTQNMIREGSELYEPWAGGMDGGIDNPLGARALYLHRGGKDTLYRIHGTNDIWSIGKATSAGCIRLWNQDILDLYERVDSGTRVVVRTEAERGKGTRPPGAGVAVTQTTPVEPTGDQTLPSRDAASSGAPRPSAPAAWPSQGCRCSAAAARRRTCPASRRLTTILTGRCRAIPRATSRSSSTSTINAPTARRTTRSSARSWPRTATCGWS